MALDQGPQAQTFSAPGAALIAAADRLQELVTELVAANDRGDHEAVIHLANQAQAFAVRLPGRISSVVWSPGPIIRAAAPELTEAESRALAGDR